MSLYNYDSAVIECVYENQPTFSNAQTGDIIIYPSRPSQGILLGTRIDKHAPLVIRNNKIGLGQMNDPAYDVHLKGSACFESMPIHFRNSTLHFNDKDNNVQGIVGMSDKSFGLSFYTQADRSHFVVLDNLDMGKVNAIIDNIPIHSLKPKKKPLPESSPPLLGCLAYEVHEHYPHAVSTDMIDYTRLVPILLLSIKDLKKRVETLEGL